MSDLFRCPGCGSVAFEAGPAGLCPRCLMQRVMADEPLDTDLAEFSTESASPDAETVDTPRSGPGRAARRRDFAVVAQPTQTEGPRAFGDYEIQGVLGRGGMGVVYLARQVSLDRSVALKMIRRDVDLGDRERRRFRNESLAVAQLDHPGIVPIYEVGETGGRPFFSMKRIDGGSLDRRLIEFAIDPRAAASLMIAIAEAVHHAHVRGILHRDLKPANVLIDRDGRPVVTDFGLAKRIEGPDDQTQPGAILGTPAYTSPEQASGLPGVVTTASDVYGLGAVLYALLVGKAPFSGSSALNTLQAVREQPPVPPRKANPNVPRDLETICLKCLEKEPHRRYASAQAIVDDLCGWLDGRPISARPASRAERLGLWCRRNPAVAGLSAALVIAIVAGSVGIVANWRKVLHERDLLVVANKKVDRELRTTRAINGILTNGLLNYAYPPHQDLTVVELLDRISPAVDALYQDQPDLEAAVRRFVGDALRAQGRLDEAEPHLTRALALSQSPGPDAEEGRLDSLHALGALRRDQGRLDEARSLAESAYQGRGRLLGPVHESTLDTANLLAAVLRNQGRPDQAEAILSPIAGPARESLGGLHPTVVLTDSNLAALALDRGRLEEAEVRLRDLLERLPNVQPEPEKVLAQVRNNLGGVYHQTGRLAEAEVEYRAAYDWTRGILDDSHPLRMTYQNNLAAVIFEQGRADEAVEILKAAESDDGPDRPESIQRKRTLAVALMRLEEFDRAEPLFRRIAAWSRGRQPPDLTDATRHAAALADLHRWDEAIGLLTEAGAVVGNDPSKGPIGPDAVGMQVLLGWCLLENGQLDRAAPILEQTHQARSADPSMRPWQVAISSARLGSLHALQGDRESAESLLLAAGKGIESDPDAPAVRRREVLARITEFYENWPGRESEAGPWKARAGHQATDHPARSRDEPPTQSD